MHVGVYLFLHVVVLVAQLNLDRALAVLLVHTGSDRLDEVLAVFKLLAVVVADDVAQLGFLAVAVDAQQMVEALIAVGGLGDVGLGNEGVELASQTTGVDHLALGITRVYAHTLDDDLGGSSIEVLILQVAQVAAIHGVGPLASELLDIEVMGTHAYLLVGIESHTDVAVLDFVVVTQIAHRLDNLGYTRLVVGTEQRVAVGHDDVLALVVEQLGKLGWR